MLAFHPIILVAILFVCIIYLLKHNYKYFKTKGIVYDKPFLFFGSFYQVVTSKQHIIERIAEIYNQYKQYPYIGFFIFTKPIILINSPELLRKVLVKDFEKFSDRNIAANEKIDPLAFHSLFTSKGQNWKGLRNKLSPLFTSGKIKLMMPLMLECGETFAFVLQRNNGQPLDFRSLTRRYSVDVISSCAFGINSFCLKDEDSEFLDLAIRLLNTQSLKRNLVLFCFFFLPKLVDILRLKFVAPEVSSRLLEIFTNTLVERRNNNIVRNDLIDLLTNLKKQEKDDDEYTFNNLKMASQAISFYAAGNETTSMTIANTLYELSFNKEIQNRLRDELQQSFLANGGFTYEGLQELKYLNMVVSETLRKYPLTTFLNRETLTDYTMDDGKIIDKGTCIMIPVGGLHFDPSYYPNPHKYDPERFNDENKLKILPYTYLPFGEGPRNCIGQRFGLLSTKIALSYLIKDFEFNITEETPIPLKWNTKSIFLVTDKSIVLRVNKV